MPNEPDPKRVWTFRRLWLTEPPDPEKIDEVADLCGAILQGNHPAVQGLAIAALAATWIKGHSKNLRVEVFTEFVNWVRSLLKSDG